MTREFVIAAATARLILGGVLAAFPDLKFVISHTGGGIASILDRIERYVDVWGDRFWTELGGTPPFEEPYGESFRKNFDKIFFDLAGFEGRMNAVKCALTTISPDRLVFGTDYPYNFTKDPDGVKRYIDNIEGFVLPFFSYRFGMIFICPLPSLVYFGKCHFFHWNIHDWIGRSRILVPYGQNF